MNGILSWRYPRGAIPSPRHKLLAAMPHRPRSGVPDSFLAAPPKLQFWGNDTYGDCVSAEEAFAKAAFPLYLGLPPLMIPDDVLTVWAKQHGFLNGADLTDVMDAMVTDGITFNGVTYKDGPPSSVDYTSDSVLSSAIYTGPIKIGVAAGQLETAVNTTNGLSGWFLSGAKNDQDEDHSVSLPGFGPAQVLASLLGRAYGITIAVPSKVSPTARCYALFTWQSIGIIDQPSLIAICGEAWLRNPTTPGLVPPTPVPTPVPPSPVPPGPGPVPSWSGSYQAGPLLFDYTCTINDPPPPVGS